MELVATRDGSFAGEVAASSSSLAAESIQKHLANSRSSLVALRWRVRCAWSAVAVSLGVGLHVALLFLHRQVERSAAVGICYIWLMAFRLGLLSLAPVVRDLVFCRAMVLGDLLLLLGERAIWTWVTWVDGNETIRDWLLANSIWYVATFVFAALGAWALLSASIAEIQRRMWLALGFHCGMIVTVFSAITLHDMFRLHNFTSHSWFPVPPFGALLFLALRPDLRKKIQGRALQWLEGRAAVQGAASLACLVGSVSPAQAVKMARQRFRCMELKKISLEVMADNTPSPIYNSLSQICGLGSCAAFVSHSWQDDAVAKWRGLQNWGAAFADRSGSEPLLWLDRCCICQTEIDTDLRCLPIFLKGCKRLVVLCGPTYLSRLWCILEIFVHVHMGGSLDDIELVQILREGFELQDAKAIEESFENFDVQNCQCYDPADKRKIGAMIEISFGSLDTFNRIVSSMIGRVRSKLNTEPPGTLTSRPVVAGEDDAV